jgi:hypothetical protein
VATPATWYLKRDGRITGPFSTGQIKRDIVLGRIRDSESLSTDATTWLAVAEIFVFRDLKPAMPGSAEFARVDERQTERRGGNTRDAAVSERPRSGHDRRRAEPGAIRSRRAKSRAVWLSLAEPKPRAVMAWLIIAAASAVVLYVGVNFNPAFPTPVDCMKPAVPGVNWTACRHAQSDLRRADLRGALLKNADLSDSDLAGANLGEVDAAYANLRAANLTLANLELSRLVGTNLRGAGLSHANLHAADLQYADLRDAQIDGARLEGALLSHAIWVNGVTCAGGSVGVCRSP